MQYREKLRPDHVDFDWIPQLVAPKIQTKSMMVFLVSFFDSRFDFFLSARHFCLLLVSKIFAVTLQRNMNGIYLWMLFGAVGAIDARVYDVSTATSRSSSNNNNSNDMRYDILNIYIYHKQQKFKINNDCLCYWHTNFCFRLCCFSSIRSILSSCVHFCVILYLGMRHDDVLTMPSVWCSCNWILSFVYFRFCGCQCNSIWLDVPQQFACCQTR